MGTDGPGDGLYGGLLRSGRADATVVRMLLGHQLRRLREAAGVTADQAAEEIRASRAKISPMENGRVGFKARDVAGLLTLYGITSEQTRAAMLQLAHRASTLSWVGGLQRHPPRLVRGLPGAGSGRLGHPRL